MLQQLLLFLNEIFTSRSSVNVIYLDFKKAFDSVAHSELLLKLWNFGITGNVWHWLQNYLNNRHQCVSINGQISSMLPVLSGVPQGSILGPLLFIIYINDLPQCVSPSSRLLLYADDAKCLKSIECPEDTLRLQNDLNALTAWSFRWSLSFNVSKCATMCCSLDSSVLPNNTFQIDNQTVPSVNTFRDLGVIMTSNLDWSKHYQHYSD